jgi:hypothetical protein
LKKFEKIKKIQNPTFLTACHQPLLSSSFIGLKDGIYNEAEEGGFLPKP